MSLPQSPLPIPPGEARGNPKLDVVAVSQSTTDSTTKRIAIETSTTIPWRTDPIIFLNVHGKANGLIAPTITATPRSRERCKSKLSSPELALLHRWADAGVPLLMLRHADGHTTLHAPNGVVTGLRRVESDAGAVTHLPR